VFGLWVGLLAAGIIVFLPTLTNLRVQGQEVTAWLLGLAVAEGSPAGLIVQGVQALVLAVLGGWLGGLTLPAYGPIRPVDADR
jgi:hypothetical protein